MKILKLMIVATLLTMLSSCDSNTSLVKNGVLEMNGSLTVGEAFDNYKYFKEVEWSEFESDNGRDVVEIYGTADMEAHPSSEEWRKQGIVEMKLFFQFVVLRDGESFELLSGGLEMTGRNGKVVVKDAAELGLTQFDLMSNIQEIYNNVPFS